MPIALSNVRVFDGKDELTGQSVILADGLIREVLPASDIPDGMQKLDLGGAVLAPGFIDTQVNGGGGVLFNNNTSVDFSENEVEEVNFEFVEKRRQMNMKKAKSNSSSRQKKNIKDSPKVKKELVQNKSRQRPSFVKHCFFFSRKY